MPSSSPPARPGARSATAPTPALKHTSDSVDVRVRRQPVAVSVGDLHQRSGRAGRQGNTLKRPSSAGSPVPHPARARGGFLDDDVRVRPGESEPTDPGDPGPPVARPTGRPRRPPAPEAGPTECAATHSRNSGVSAVHSCSSDRMTLISPAIPAAASRCPMFVFTDPISSGRPGSRVRRRTPHRRLGLRSDRPTMSRFRAPPGNRRRWPRHRRAAARRR